MTKNQTHDILDFCTQHDIPINNISMEILEYVDLNNELEVIKVTDEINKNLEYNLPYSIHIMCILRFHLGLSRYNTSKDAEIAKMSKSEVFKIAYKKYGLLRKHYKLVKELIVDIYGVE